MTKIATKGTCNIIEAGNMNSGSFLGDLIACPTYKEITEIGKFNVSGTYENNQLVKESDITKYTGKTKNYSFIWAEYDLTTYIGQTSFNGTILNLKFKQNFLYAPDTDLKIVINFSLYTKGDESTGALPSFTPKSLTVNFTQKTGSDKNFAYTQNYSTTFKTRFESISINNVTITPVNGTSQYEYVTIKKNVTQNYFVNVFSVASTGFYIDSYADDTNKKNITNQCRISPKFNIPTGVGVNDIDIYIDETNFTDGSSVGVTYNPTYNSATYTFNAIDAYGERGYKLPYFYAKFVLEQRNTRYKSYAHAIWDPASTQTGIELTNLILDE
jgi:hypothetical protein